VAVSQDCAPAGGQVSAGRGYDGASAGNLCVATCGQESWKRVKNGSAAVLVVFLLALTHGDNTSVGHFTHCMFKLNRGVVDAEVSMQAFLYIPQDALAHRGGNVGNRDVAREGASFRADAPTVKVVHVVDAVDGADGGLDQFKLHAAGRALEQDIKCFADDAEA